MYVIYMYNMYIFLLTFSNNSYEGSPGCGGLTITSVTTCPTELAHKRVEKSLYTCSKSSFSNPIISMYPPLIPHLTESNDNYHCVS